MRISDWSSDVCSSDLHDHLRFRPDQGICRRSDDRHRNVGVHRRDGHAADGVPLASCQTPGGAGDMRLLKIVPDNTSFRFVRLRWFAFAFTILLTGASIALVASRGLTLGVDFVGGLMIVAGLEPPDRK